MSIPFPASQPFLKFLAKWQADLPSFTLDQAIPNPNQTAVICVDMINGFCHFGALSSPAASTPSSSRWLLYSN